MADTDYHFFLHFHDSDHEQADIILQYLENPPNGFNGFVLNRNFETGTQSHSLDVALRCSRLLIILLSREALENKRFRCLLDTCFEFHIRKKCDIVPVYLEKIEKPDVFKTIDGINYTGPLFWDMLKTRVSRTVS